MTGHSDQTRDVSQAVHRPGGESVVTRDARNKKFTNSVRLSFSHIGHSSRTSDWKVIYKSVSTLFGENSEEVKEIQGIGKGVNQTWIIEYTSLPKDIIGKSINVNGSEILIEDASAAPTVFEKKIETSTMKFKIQGLPLDATQNDLLKELRRIGFDVKNNNDMRQVFDNSFGHFIRTEIVLFRIICENNKKMTYSNLTGEHLVIIGDFEYKININCFGFCFRCKKEGHLINTCIEKKASKTEKVTCFHCKVIGHVKRECSKYKEEIKEKERNSKCLKCKKKGHYARNCTDAPLGWYIDLDSFPSLEKQNEKTVIKKSQTDHLNNQIGNSNEEECEKISFVENNDTLTRTKPMKTCRRDSVVKSPERKKKNSVSNSDVDDEMDTEIAFNDLLNDEDNTSDEDDLSDALEKTIQT